VETVTRTAWDPITKEKYKIEMPAPEEIRQAILKLDYPSDGIRIKDTAVALAEKFQLSNDQRDAENSRGDEVFYHDVVYPQFVHLLKKGKLDQPGGPKASYFLAVIPQRPLPVEHDLGLTRPSVPALLPRLRLPVEHDLGLTPEKSIKDNYQQIRDELASELLQKIKDNTPAFFEKLVIDLLFKMGYGGSREDAQAIGRSGDGGIDGIIKADPLGLNVVYVQAKRWEGKVGAPPVRDFVGALDGEGVQEGIFITTSDFNPAAKEFAERSSKRVILINGSQLARYMIDHNVGVSTTKTYEIKRVDSDYFAENSENP